MFLTNWLRPRPATKAQHTRTRLGVQQLEDRTVPDAAALDPTFGTGGLVTTDLGRWANNSPVYGAFPEIMIGPSPDVTFARGWTAVATQPDGRVVVAGTTNSNSAQYGYDFWVARYTSDGLLDPTFNGTGQVSIDFGSGWEGATGVTVQPDGGIVVVGSTQQGLVSGRDHGYDFAVARLTAEGELDTGFGGGDGKVLIDFAQVNGGANDMATGVALEGDKIVIAGGLSEYNADTQSDFLVARLLRDGTLDGTFGAGTINRFGEPTPGLVAVNVGLNFGARGVAVQGVGADAKIVVAGMDMFYGQASAVLRLNNNGTRDATFGTDGVFSVSGTPGSVPISITSVAVDGGSVVVAGYHLDNNWDPESGVPPPAFEFAVARLTQYGQLDGNFGDEGVRYIDFGSTLDMATAVAVHGDGIVLAGMTFPNSPGSSYEDHVEFAVARLTETGQLDSTFGDGGKQRVAFGSNAMGEVATGLAVANDGRVVVAGYPYNGGSPYSAQVPVARLTDAGQLDTSFGGGGRVLTTQTLPASLDETYDGVGNNTQVAVQADGKILVVGYSNQPSPTGQDFAVVRYNPDGTVDPSFGTNGRVTIDFGGGADIASGIAVQPDGRIVIAGSSQSGAVRDFAVARMLGDGSLDLSFGSGGRATVTVGSFVQNVAGVAVLGTGSCLRIVVAGHVMPEGNFVVACLTGSGILDEDYGDGGTQAIPFGPGSWASGMAVQGDKILVAGYAYSATTGGDYAVARLTADGQPDPTFDTDGRLTLDLGAEGDYGAPDDFAAGVVVQGNQLIVAGTTYLIGEGGQYLLGRFSAVRLNDNGTQDESFGNGGRSVVNLPGRDSWASGIAVQPGGKIVIVGSASSGGPEGQDVATLRLRSDGTPDTTFDGDGWRLSDFGHQNDYPGGVAVQTDGRIVVAGQAGPDFAVARYQGNVAPAAGDLTASTPETAAVNGQVPAADGDGDALAFSVVNPPANGTLVFNPGGSFTYTPVTGYSDSFTYRAFDGVVYSDEATVTITVANVAPTAAGVAGPSSGVAGQVLTFTLGTADAPGDAAAGFTYGIDWNDGSPAQTVTGPPATTASHAFTPGTYSVRVRATDRDGDTGDWSAPLVVTVSPLTTASLQQQFDQLPPAGEVTVSATTQEAVTAVVAAVNTLAPAAQPVGVVVDLGGGDFAGITGSPPANVTLTFVNGTFNGASPALTVSSGVVVVRDSLLQNGTDAPTILLTGGLLILRNNDIQESTGYTQAAVRVTGGTLDLGTAADPGHNTLNVNGAGVWIQNVGGNAVSAVGNTYRINGAAPTAPAVGAVTAPLDPVQKGTVVSAAATFTGTGPAAAHTAVWNWGDGSTSAGTVTESLGAGSVTGTHAYNTAAGVYTVTLTVTDIATGTFHSSVFEYVVVYDASAGFVTGGGWTNSPAGALVGSNATGKATFGFVSKYQNGNSVPTGNTEFQFKLGNFNFKSTSYDWMAISGAKVRYKGTGTVNGSGSYGFQITAIDGQVNGGGGADKFRIKIWNKATGAVVYDNQMNAADDADPTTLLGGGSIVIHR